MICQPGGTKRDNCWASGITYRIKCKPCLKDGKLAQYTGESGRSSFTRGLEHGKHFGNLKRGQPLSDHARSCHPGGNLGIEDFEMRVTGRYTRALPRLISEGIQIDELLHNKQLDPTRVEVLNSKQNFHQARTVRVVAMDQKF